MLGKKHKLKRGRLSKEEKSKIEQLIFKYNDVEIGEKIRRPTAMVKQYRLQFLSQNPDLVVQKSQQQEIKEQLRNEPEWAYFKEQFTEDELILFENSYAQLMEQFKSDVMATEKKQIFQAITLEIFIHRHNIDRKLAQDDTDRLSQILDKEYDLPEDKQNTDRIMELERQLLAARQSTQARTKELKDLMEKYQMLIKGLKATREQRIEKLESAKGTIAGLLRKLEDEESRKGIAVEMNLMEAAVSKEYERLSGYHVYQDKSVSRPILNSHSTTLDEDKK